VGCDPLDPIVTEALRAWRVQYQAGVSLTPTLESCASMCRTAEARAAFAEAARRAASSQDAATLLAALAPALSEGERAVVAAGFKSGRLDSALDAVAGRRAVQHATRSTIRARLALPAMVLLLAALVIPLPALVLGGGLWAYALGVALPLALAVSLWSLVGRWTRARMASGMQDAQGGPAPADKADDLLLSVPIAQGLERARNLSECAGLLADLLGAGLLLSDALEICARTAPNGRYRADRWRASRATRTGNPLSQALVPGRLWPAEFCAALAVAEHAGALEETCRRLGTQWREQYAEDLRQIGEWLPRLLYALVVLYILWGIVQLVTQIAASSVVPT
jgi:general secretion pathway protein F